MAFWFANRRGLTSFSNLGFHLTPVFALATGGWFLDEQPGLASVGGSVRCPDISGVMGVNANICGSTASPTACG